MTENTKKKAAMTTAERQAKYRKRHGSNTNEGRINMVVSITAVTKLGELAAQQGVAKKAMLERLILEGREHATNTLCSPEHLGKLKEIADCYAVTLEDMLERMIDPEVKRLRLRETDHMEKNTEIALFLLDLFGGDQDKARREYRAHLQRINPEWVFVTEETSNEITRRFKGVMTSLHRQAAKYEKAPE